MAQQHPENAESASGWRRLGGHRLGWTAAIVAVTAGLLFSTTARAARGVDLRPGERGDLTALVHAEQARIEAAEAGARALREEIRRSRGHDPALPGVPGPADEEVQARELAALAGLVPVRGPAVEVTLDDAPLAARTVTRDDYNPDDYVVHEQDLQAVVNALWAGGAEAMQLMDQRVISTSAVRCVGSTLFLQGRIYPPPYRILAVGPPDQMLQALDRSSSVAEYRLYVDSAGLRYDVEKKESAVLPGYDGSLAVAKALPAEG